MAKNNDWEKHFEKFSDYIKDISVGQYDENGVNIGFKQSKDVIKDFIHKLIQKTRRVDLEEFRETVLELRVSYGQDEKDRWYHGYNEAIVRILKELESKQSLDPLDK